MGLVQRKIEAAGMSTVSVSMMPEVTASAGAPRIAAIEHPFGLTMGLPGDRERQLAVLRGALRAVEEIPQPGGVVHLPLEWNGGEKVKWHPPELPPIAAYLARHPWQLGKFFNRTPPEI